jgi:cytochrome b pre-mRNA-processing protein 3
MLWPFNHFRKPRLAPRGTIETIYGTIVTQAREPVFYQDLGVPDTVNGRFDLIVLHLWMVLHRLRLVGAGTDLAQADLAQALFDRFCEDMDANLREMGVGDLTVPKRMQAFGEAFYGRAAAYDRALSDGAEVLARALAKNLLNENILNENILNEDILNTNAAAENARQLAAYVEAAMSALAHQDDAALLGGSCAFPLPHREAAAS